MKKIKGLRFIIGSNCNLNCFFCHHEGYLTNSKVGYAYDAKLEKLKSFCEKNNVYNISITGGEPFLFFEYLQKILNVFSDNKFKITINSNFTLIDRYINYIQNYKKIEFHVNLSSLDREKHKGIVGGGNYLKKVLSNLNLIKSTHHKICLNILVLKHVNDNSFLS